MEIQKMKVLFVTTAYKRFAEDIITPWLTELIIRLKVQNIDVSVFTSSYKGLGNQILDNIKIYRFRYFFKKYEALTHDETVADRLSRSPINFLLVICYMIMGAWSIVQHVRKEHYDIVHVHWPLPHIIFGALARIAGKTRLFSTFYGLEIRWFKKKFPWFIKPLKTMINKSNVITAISTHTRQELQDIIQKKIDIIPFSAAVPEKKTKYLDENHILFVGRLVERKGVKYLIKAFAEIKDQITQDLVIIGDGPERKNLERLVEQLNLRSRINLKGWISAHEKLAYYEKCSLFVLPAVYDKQGDIEGLGVVLIEAMSCSKPVIASNAGGITDIVENEFNGLLVPPGDIKKLAYAIKKLAKDPELRQKMGRRAKESIDEKFNWDRIVHNLIILYKNN